MKNKRSTNKTAVYISLFLGGIVVGLITLPIIQDLLRVIFK